MQSLLEHPVSFRLSAKAYSRYQAEAHQLGMGLSAYLRMRLDSDDGVSEQISQLRLALLDQAASEFPGNTPAPVMLELLLLLRRLVSPADLRSVHQELTRLGSTPWSPNHHYRDTDA